MPENNVAARLPHADREHLMKLCTPLYTRGRVFGTRALPCECTAQWEGPDDVSPASGPEAKAL